MLLPLAGTARQDKRRDFDLLEEANAVLLQYLRKDEMAPELARTFESGSGGPPSHSYFCSVLPSLAVAPHVRYEGVTPWPPQLSEQFARVECMSFMGLLPEIGHAWMSVDNRLYLWDYEQSQSFEPYDWLPDVVLAVALAPPQPDVFREIVKYVLVVATTTEIRILAVTYPDSGATAAAAAGGPLPALPPAWGRMVLRNTQFSASTDGVTVTRIAVHTNGRIFLCGRDGSFSELMYGTHVQGLVLRSLSKAMALGLGSSWDSLHRDCRTVTHSGGRAGWLPTFVATLTRVGGLFGGGAAGGGSIVDAAVDPWRGALYLADLGGALALYDLGTDATATSSRARIDIWLAARDFCARAERWRAAAPPGLPPALHFDPGHGFRVVGLHPVDPSESSRVHLVVVASSGFRIFVGTGGGSRPDQLMVMHVRAPPPPALWKHIREAFGAAEAAASAPAATTAQSAGRGRAAGDSIDGAPAAPVLGGDAGGAGGGRQGPMHLRYPEPHDGFQPAYAKGSGMDQIHTSYYSHGLTLLANGLADDGGALVAIVPDAVARRRPRQERGGLVAAADAASSMTNSAALPADPPSMREVVVEVGEGGGPQKPLISGAVWALGEEAVLSRDPSAAGLAALLVASRTPSDGELASQKQRLEGSGRPGGGGGGFGWRGVAAGGAGGAGGYYGAAEESPQLFPLPPPPPPICLPPGGGLAGRAAAKCTFTAAHAAPLPEAAMQHLRPQRTALCLSAAGLHRLRRLRSIDRLRELLREADVTAIREFYSDLGAEQASAASFAVACGLPLPAPTPGKARVAAAAPVVPDAAELDIRCRAVAVLRDLGGHPTIGIPQSVGGGAVNIGGTNAFPAQGAAFLTEQYAASPRHDGLLLFLSRLLRPVWFRPVVVDDTAAAVAAHANAPAHTVGTKRDASGAGRSAGGLSVPMGAAGGGAGEEEDSKTWLRPLLDPAQLQMLHEPLAALLSCIRELYPHAVATDIGTAGGGGRHGSGGGGGGGGGGFGAADNGMLGHPMTLVGAVDVMRREEPRGRANRQNAIRQEDHAVHATYRLASRAAQAIALLQEVSAVQEGSDGGGYGTLTGVAGPAVLALRQLRGLAFWQLVVSEVAHRRAEAALMALVTPSMRLTPQAADIRAGALGRCCFFYFSRGNMLAHEGLSCLLEAASLAESQPGSQALRQKVSAAIQALTAAAGCWRFPSDASSPSGPLHRACVELRRLGAHDGAIEVCLTCAENFRPQAGVGRDALLAHTLVENGTRAVGGAFMPWALPGAHSSWTNGSSRLTNGGSYGVGNDTDGGATAAGWERGLYHGRPAAGEAEESNACKACYNEALKTIEELLDTTRLVGAEAAIGRLGGGQETPEERKERFISALRAALCSEDRVFHFRLYDLLRERDPERLVCIKTTFIEEYLRRADVELLGKYFSQAKRHGEAAQLFQSLAIDDGANGDIGGCATLKLEQRMECLAKALTAARAAVEDGNGAGRLSDLEERLDVASIQKKVVDMLLNAAERLEAAARAASLGGGGGGTSAPASAFQNAARIRRELAEKLSYRLADATELFNDVAYPFCLFECCLLIMVACQYDDPQLAGQLWRSLLYQDVPRRAEDPAASWLSVCRSRPGMLQDEVTNAEAEVSLPGATGAGGIFEDSRWLPALCQRVLRVAALLQPVAAGAGGRDPPLPVALLVAELEGLAAQWSATTRGSTCHVVAKTLREAGFQRHVLFEAYLEAFWQHHEQAAQVHLLREIAALLTEWVDCATGRPPRAEDGGGSMAAKRMSASAAAADAAAAATSLRAANRDGALEERIQKLQTHLQALYRHGEQQAVVVKCQEALEYVRRRLCSGDD